MYQKLGFLHVVIRRIAFVMLLLAWCSLARTGNAAPTIVSVVPASGSNNVSVSSTVVFTFSTPMYTSSAVIFTNAATGAYLPATSAWSVGNTVLTCTPSPTWPANAQVNWTVFGFDTSFNALTGTTTGTFGTGAGGSGTSGTGTNAFTTISLGHAYVYNQASTNTPTLDTGTPYEFFSSVVLSSNRSASSITMALPTGSVSNLTDNPIHPEQWFTAYLTTNLTTYNAVFPSGNHTFTVQSGTSNQVVTVSLPTTMAQPPAPHISNYAAAQSVDPTKAFTLAWDAFSGGAAADFIGVVVGPYSLSAVLTTNVLNGTATSIVVPANTLAVGSNYTTLVTFYHYATNNSAFFGTTATTIAYKVTSTHFILSTVAAGPSAPPVITNATVSVSGGFSFRINTSPNQTVTIITSTNLETPKSQWQPIFTNSSASGSFIYINTRPLTNSLLYYGVKSGQ